MGQFAVADVVWKSVLCEECMLVLEGVAGSWPGFRFV